MALFILLKLILQTRMHSHPVGLDVWLLVRPFVYFHTSCVRTAKALVRLRGCAGSPEPSLVAYVISTIISLAAHFIFIPAYSSLYLKCFWYHYRPTNSILLTYEPHHEKTCLCHMRTTKAQISLHFSAFVVWCLYSIIPIFAKSRISRL